MAPPADIPKVPSIGLPPAPPAPVPLPDNALAGRSPAAPLLPAADQADIRPLDVPGGLQILITEVRAALEAALLAAISPGASPRPGSPATASPPAASTPASALLAALNVPLEALPAAASAPEAARQLVELLLKALPPESPDEAPFAQRLPALDSAVQSASAQALSIIDSWRAVPVATQAAAHLAVQLAANALGDEVLQAAWLRPEWAGLLPRLERFRARRRRLKRRLQDPDAREPPADDERR